MGLEGKERKDVFNMFNLKKKLQQFIEKKKQNKYKNVKILNYKVKYNKYEKFNKFFIFKKTWAVNNNNIEHLKVYLRFVKFKIFSKLKYQRYIFFNNLLNYKKNQNFFYFNFFYNYKGLIKYKNNDILINNINLKYLFLKSIKNYKVFNLFRGNFFDYISFKDINLFKDNFFYFFYLKFYLNNINQKIFIESLLNKDSINIFQVKQNKFYNFFFSLQKKKNTFFKQYWYFEFYIILKYLNCIIYNNIFNDMNNNNNNNIIIHIFNDIILSMFKNIKLNLINFKYIKIFKLNLINFKYIKIFKIYKKNKINMNVILLKFLKVFKLYNNRRRSDFKTEYFNYWKYKFNINFNIFQRLKYINSIFFNNRYKYLLNYKMFNISKVLNNAFAVKDDLGFFIALFVCNYNYFWKMLWLNYKIKQYYIFIKMARVYKLILMKLLKIFYSFKLNFNSFNFLKLYLKFKIKNYIFLYKIFKKNLKFKFNINNLFLFILQNLNVLNKKLYNKYSILNFSKYLKFFFKKYNLNYIVYNRMKKMLKWYSLNELLSWRNFEFNLLYYDYLFSKFRLIELIKLKIIKLNKLNFIKVWKKIFFYKKLLNSYFLKFIYFNRKKGYIINYKNWKKISLLMVKFNLFIKTNFNFIIYKKWISKKQLVVKRYKKLNKLRLFKV
jgi:hypothetical protein